MFWIVSASSQCRYQQKLQQNLLELAAMADAQAAPQS